jgi:hypothetical protein
MIASLPDAARRGTEHARCALMLAIHSEGPVRDSEGHKVETAVEARAGFLDRPVLVVPCASLALGVVVLGVLWLGFTYLYT